MFDLEPSQDFLKEEYFRSQFAQTFTKILFPYLNRITGLKEAGLADAVFNPQPFTRSFPWASSSILTFIPSTVEGFCPRKTIQFLSRIASTQVIEYYLTYMNEDAPELYHQLTEAAKPIYNRRQITRGNDLTPHLLADGVAGGNREFYGKVFPWIVVAGFYGTTYAENIHRQLTNTSESKMAERMATAKGLSEMNTMQERLVRLFGPIDNTSRSLAVELIDKNKKFENGSGRCPAVDYVNTSFLWVAREAIYSKQFENFARIY